MNLLKVHHENGPEEGYLPDCSSATTKAGFAEQFLDQSQARGEFIVSVDQLAQAGQMTHIAVRRQLEHLSQRVQHLPGRPSAYLIVPPEHLARGAPPVAAWLDAYFRLRGQPYYVGLLSAAALHGSSSQALQVTQILTTKPMRPMHLGRLHVDFYVKKHLRQTPLSSLAGMPAPLALSSPEATILDLIAFSDRIGGRRRVTEVIADFNFKGVINMRVHGAREPRERATGVLAQSWIETLKLAVSVFHHWPLTTRRARLKRT
jgi:hypothetical protein